MSFVYFSPSERLNWHIDMCLFDGVEMMSSGAFQSLLLLLQQPANWHLNVTTRNETHNGT